MFNKPTVNNQIIALFGVRDVLLMMAREEVNATTPNHYYLFDYLGKSIDIAASALFTTFCAGGRDPVANMGETPIPDDHGFAEPYEYKPTEEKKIDAGGSNV